MKTACNCLFIFEGKCGFLFLKLMNKLSQMSQRKILAMAGATGVTMFGLIYTTLNNAVDSKAIEKIPNAIEVQTPTIGIVTAAVDIPAQTIIQENMLKMTQMPQDMISTTAVRDPSKLIGKVTRVDVLTDDVLTEKKFFHNIDQAGMIGLIPPDCRAISIAISDVTGVSGFINPGDYVDVMMVYDANGEIHSEIILQNVLLLAMGSKAAQTDKGILESAAAGLAAGMATAVNSADKSVSTATLALRADEVLKVAAASRKGVLYLIMRPFRPDDEFVDDVQYSLSGQKNNSTSTFDGYNIELPTVEPIAAPVVDKPAPAFQPPASPVVDKPAPAFKPPSSPTVENTFETPPQKGIEIIQGDQIVSK